MVLRTRARLDVYRCLDSAGGEHSVEYAIAKSKSKNKRVIDSSDDTDRSVIPDLTHTGAVASEGPRHLVAFADR